MGKEGGGDGGGDVAADEDRLGNIKTEVKLSSIIDYYLQH